jgi:arylsulfatase A-like enzyme
MALPKNYLPQHPFDNGEMTVRDERLAPWPRTEPEVRRHLHEYYAAISGMDFHVGRLLAALKDLGLAQNTIVVFSADNGLAVGSHGLMGKQNLYEHSAGVPLIVAGPGIRPGRSPALVYLMDLFPTICELAGVAVPPGLDGRSLKPVLDGKRPGIRDTVFLSYGKVQRAVRDARWKLLRYPRVGKSQLFDLRADPEETRDLSADPAQAERVAGLTEELRRWQRQLGDDQPLSVASPGDPRFTPPAEKP